MRSALLGLSVLLLFAIALGSPTKGSPAPCKKECAFNYTPICGKPQTGKGTDISFGNKCVMDKYNCEHPSAEYEKKQDGECPGGAPVRLQ